MELTNIHPAEAYLRNEQNPSFLYIRIYGERRKLFINRGGENAIGIIAKGKRKRGYIFTDWDNIEKSTPPHRIMKRTGTGNYSLNTSGSHALPHIPTTGSGKLPQPTRKSPCMRTILRQEQ